VEHPFDPPSFAHTLFDLADPGGLAIISTPYHGYWKNLAMSLTGKLDSHFTALWVGGNIKFWVASQAANSAYKRGIHADRISARWQNPYSRKIDDRPREKASRIGFSRLVRSIALVSYSVYLAHPLALHVAHTVSNPRRTLISTCRPARSMT
jgi:hypothetical protein